jgi:hypothetical protein
VNWLEKHQGHISLAKPIQVLIFITERSLILKPKEQIGALAAQGEAV